jgi:hypothetical protein
MTMQKNATWTEIHQGGFDIQKEKNRAIFLAAVPFCSLLVG